MSISPAMTASRPRSCATSDARRRRPRPRLRRPGEGPLGAQLLAAGVGCVAVTTGAIEDVLQSDDFGHTNGFVVDVEHPVFEVHPRLAPLVRFSRSATQAKGGVLAGNATDAVLGEIGYTPAEIDDLRARKIIGSATLVDTH
jgi:crotonobetainyl-CoA:carnitine CoA-transferase CaiB-like acyl-CoA transferase